MTSPVKTPPNSPARSILSEASPNRDGNRNVQRGAQEVFSHSYTYTRGPGTPEAVSNRFSPPPRQRPQHFRNEDPLAGFHIARQLFSDAPASPLPSSPPAATYERSDEDEPAAKRAKREKTEESVTSSPETDLQEEPTAKPELVFGESSDLPPSFPRGGIETSPGHDHPRRGQGEPSSKRKKLEDAFNEETPLSEAGTPPSSLISGIHRLQLSSSSFTNSSLHTTASPASIAPITQPPSPASPSFPERAIAMVRHWMGAFKAAAQSLNEPDVLALPEAALQAGPAARNLESLFNEATSTNPIMQNFSIRDGILRYPPNPHVLPLPVLSAPAPRSFQELLLVALKDNWTNGTLISIQEKEKLIPEQLNTLARVIALPPHRGKNPARKNNPYIPRSIRRILYLALTNRLEILTDREATMMTPEQGDLLDQFLGLPSRQEIAPEENNNLKLAYGAQRRDAIKAVKQAVKTAMRAARAAETAGAPAVGAATKRAAEAAMDAVEAVKQAAILQTAESASAIDRAAKAADVSTREAIEASNNIVRAAEDILTVEALVAWEARVTAAKKAAIAARAATETIAAFLMPFLIAKSNVRNIR